MYSFRTISELYDTRITSSSRIDYNQVKKQKMRFNLKRNRQVTSCLMDESEVAPTSPSAEQRLFVNRLSLVRSSFRKGILVDASFVVAVSVHLFLFVSRLHVLLAVFDAETAADGAGGMRQAGRGCRRISAGSRRCWRRGHFSVAR